MMLSATGTGQSFEDKLQAVKYFISGQGISFIVLKATTSELMGPKRKHLDYLVQMTNEPNVSIPSLVKHLMIRARNPEWSVAFKSLITIHHLMTYGNEKFVQNLASSIVNNQSFDRLCLFADRFTILGYNMSIFLRRYSRYLNVKTKTYRSLGTDFCRIEKPQLKANKQTQVQQTKQTTLTIETTSRHVEAPLKLREMPMEQLVKVVPILQNQFDVLLAFDVSIDDLCNGIINAAFAMLYKDFIKLYIAYQTAIIRLLELYFSVTQMKQAKELLEIYKKFLVRMDKVSDFMRVVDAVGMDKSDMPNVSRAPELSLRLLERHLDTLQQSTPRRTCDGGGLGRMLSVDLAACYGSLGRPPASLQRRRSLRNTPTRQTSLDVLSPMAAQNYMKRFHELRRLDKMLFGTSADVLGGGRESDSYDLIGQPIEENDNDVVDDQPGKKQTNSSTPIRRPGEQSTFLGDDSTFEKISMIARKQPLLVDTTGGVGAKVLDSTSTKPPGADWIHIEI